MNKQSLNQFPFTQRIKNKVKAIWIIIDQCGFSFFFLCVCGAPNRKRTTAAKKKIINVQDGRRKKREKLFISIKQKKKSYIISIRVY